MATFANYNKDGNMPASKKGFTLIELLVIVVIIGVLTAIAAPKFGGLIEKSKEGCTKGQLSALRSALDIYYGDNMLYPTDDLESLVADGKYISVIPIVKLPGTTHPENRHVTDGNTLSEALTDTGGWAYVNNSGDRDWGIVRVNCSHSDNKGQNWSEQ